METRKEYTDNRYSYDKQLPMICANCDSIDNLHIHHIVPLAFGGTNKITNMVRLCEGCHGKAHGNEGWLINHGKSIKKAKQKLREEGKWAAGLVPFGYQINDNGYLELSSDAPIVKKILTDFYVNGFKMKEIKEELESLNIKTQKGNSKWQHSTISTLLANTTYIGEVRDRYTDEITITHDVIMVDIEYLHIVRDGMKRRKAGQKIIPLSQKKEIIKTNDEIKNNFGKDAIKLYHTKKKEIKRILKGVVQLSLNEKFINEFHSVEDASAKTGVTKVNIISVCKRRTYTAGGYKWMFKEDYDQYISQAN